MTTNKFLEHREQLEDLCRRRFFYRPAFEIYGGTAGFWTYGPPGSAVKNNLIALWRKHFVIEESLMEIEDTNIMPHPVLKASGHVDRFTDFMVKDVKNPSLFFRADKLLEDHMEAMMAAKGVTAAQKEEYEKVKNMADGYSQAELTAVLKKYEVKSPETKNDLTEPYEFNLMFPTQIGPSGLVQGYLRPETAQGIFLNFPYCLEQQGGQMPFGVAQIGKAFRNEIAPRQGLLRQREFTQAEIEYFCKPGDKPHAKFGAVAELELALFSSPLQLAAQPPMRCTLGKAVRDGLVNNETLGYFIGRTYLLALRAGIQAAHIRFRQHLPTEMAHYAADCWDMEVEMSYGWIECVGIADRSAFDLTSHAAATGKDLSAREKLAEPVSESVFVLSKKASAMIGKDLKAAAKGVLAALAALPSDDLAALSATAQAAGKASLDVDGVAHELSAAHLDGKVETKTVHERVYTPNVVEPSFGIDRLLTAIYEHSYYVRFEGHSKRRARPPDARRARPAATVRRSSPPPRSRACAPLPGARAQRRRQRRGRAGEGQGRLDPRGAAPDARGGSVQVHRLPARPARDRGLHARAHALARRLLRPRRAVQGAALAELRAPARAARPCALSLTLAPRFLSRSRSLSCSRSTLRSARAAPRRAGRRHGRVRRQAVRAQR
jgi:glycyl-tRNA synthetase